MNTAQWVRFGKGGDRVCNACGQSDKNRKPVKWVFRRIFSASTGLVQCNDLGEKLRKMGGLGSGYQGPKKCTVEDCLTLSISEMMHRRAIRPGFVIWSGWNWRGPGEAPFARIDYRSDLEVDGGRIRLIYRVGGEPLDYVVRIVTTPLNNGGCRWWFLCPLAQIAGDGPRRVDKLYRPPGAKYFGSRVAHGLTYRSSQESGKWRSLHERLARETGMTPDAVRAALCRGDVVDF